MVDLEGPLPYLAAASHYKINRHHCSHGGCRFCSGLCFVCFCLLCFASPSPLFALLTRSFFLTSLSLSCCLLVVAYSPAPYLGRLQSLAPVLGGAPPWSYSLGSAVLLLGPFLGLGGPRFFGLVLVLLLGSSPHRLRLGAPHETFVLASVLLLGSLALPRCSTQNLRPRSLPRPRRSSVLRPRFSAPPRLLAFDSVLRLKPSASPRSSSSLAPRCSPWVPRCSALNPRPQCSSSVLSSGKFLFCSTVCHPFLILHFTHSTSTSLSHPADCYIRFSALLGVEFNDKTIRDFGATITTDILQTLNYIFIFPSHTPIPKQDHHITTTWSA
jgi:hypothetical protein